MLLVNVFRIVTLKSCFKARQRIEPKALAELRLWLDTPGRMYARRFLLRHIPSPASEKSLSLIGSDGKIRAFEKDSGIFPPSFAPLDSAESISSVWS